MSIHLSSCNSHQSTVKSLYFIPKTSEIQSKTPPRCLKVLISHNDLNANHCYFESSRLDGIKIFDKDNQVTKVCSFYLNVLRPGHLYQN